MIKHKGMCLLLLAGAMVVSTVFANGLQEDRGYQFKSPTQSFYLLNQELVRIKLKDGGFKQIFNVNADGASSVYVGNNSQTWVDGDQNNNTSVGNMTDIQIAGDGNTVTSGQSNADSNQTAVGASLNGPNAEVGSLFGGGI